MIGSRKGDCQRFIDRGTALKKCVLVLFIVCRNVTLNPGTVTDK